MKFLARALRLVRADAHGVMDQLEERSLLLKQHLREAEVEITRKRVRVEALEEGERRVDRETGCAERQLALLDEALHVGLVVDQSPSGQFGRKVTQRRFCTLSR